VLKVRVRAPPADGAANTALLRMMAHALGVAHRDGELAAGATSRIKRVRISGVAAALTARLREISKVKA
jgi:uncharacterized protein YggU (UPF0235/DUF167 family)